MKPKIFACIHQSDSVRMESRSGGIFTALSDYTLKNGGVVYGCKLTEEYDAVHYRATSFEERNMMRGSKYIQSRMGDVFRNVKLDLDQGKLVLFSGTSCQVAGLKNFIGTGNSNLFCVDIVCHGVPSNLIWKKYLEWQEAKHASKIIGVEFRNKKLFGWRPHKETFTFQNGAVESFEIYKELFYGHNILRPSCYVCPFKTVEHPGDITIADYWGIEKAAPEFDDNKGVSLVFVNSEIGNHMFEEIKSDIKYKPTRLEDSMQQPLIAPFPKPKNRDVFWKEFEAYGFEYIAKKYTTYGLLNKLKRKIGAIKRRIIG